jgi:hypothetical protein
MREGICRGRIPADTKDDMDGLSRPHTGGSEIDSKTSSLITIMQPGLLYNESAPDNFQLIPNPSLTPNLSLTESKQN